MIVCSKSFCSWEGDAVWVLGAEEIGRKGRKQESRKKDMVVE